MTWNDHPPSLFTQHPWHDPFASQPLGSELPPEWAINSPGAPRPGDFPFTANGRADYYAAVRSAAYQQQAMQYQAIQHVQAENAHRLAAETAAAEAAEQERRAGLLLLLS
jgi:hypothetical protein